MVPFAATTDGCWTSQSKLCGLENSLVDLMKRKQVANGYMQRVCAALVMLRQAYYMPVLKYVSQG